jgi:hypothetical protein
LLRFLLIFVIIIVVTALFFVILLQSPAPKVLALKVAQSQVSEEGYFNVDHLRVVPWAPMEVQGLEYQPTDSLSDGILNIDSVKWAVNPLNLTRHDYGHVEIDNLRWDHSDGKIARLNAHIPLGREEVISGPGEAGFLNIEGLRLGQADISEVQIKFTSKAGVYNGSYELESEGGRLTGDFTYKPFAGHGYRLVVEVLEWELDDLGELVGDNFRRAKGKCRGKLTFEGKGNEIRDASGIIECPAPGGRVQSSLMNDLSDWVPAGVAKDVLAAETREGQDFYYQEASLEVRRLKDGYWRFHLKVKNPRVHLDIPIDISDDGIRTVSNNTRLKSVLNKLSGK